MSTTSLTAGEVMDWMAALMNDVEKTSYTYVAMLPYLNMAIDELLEEMERHNVPVTNESSDYITVLTGVTRIVSIEASDTLPHYPTGLIEIRDLSERLAGTNDSFVRMQKHDFLNVRTQTASLLDWAWIAQEIRFIGAISDREIKIDYIKELLPACSSPDDRIGIIGVKSYLAYKGASFCAKYIAENPMRAKMLLDDAAGCLDNILGMASKGQQDIITRRRPFRSSYKFRGWF